MTVINQRSQVIDINWQTFSAGPTETVDFNQPNSSALAINYVIGGVPSVLQGALNASGRVYILNSAGVTFTGTSREGYMTPRTPPSAPRAGLLRADEEVVDLAGHDETLRKHPAYAGVGW